MWPDKRKHGCQFSKIGREDKLSSFSSRASREASNDGFTIRSVQQNIWSVYEFTLWLLFSLQYSMIRENLIIIHLQIQWRVWQRQKDECKRKLVWWQWVCDMAANHGQNSRAQIRLMRASKSNMCQKMSVAGCHLRSTTVTEVSFVFWQHFIS